MTKRAALVLASSKPKWCRVAVVGLGSSLAGLVYFAVRRKGGEASSGGGA